ncbi:rab proteins geranylgeranyltransferase component A [Toxorhynchites rutilus septentrionalis]|uniref:rab proteins geranylgeranyltransferase component A n=1 Tax=Toxorhynchites rutilus septentrionalis TaxID=329112 RepID=UPI00247AF85B|nr:rab proteins geranylgeranyltransferase component A [Toxorhynchites rutilus septentrionalis]
MEEDLPTEFDLIVIGTGLPESIVAAAASRVGKTVLHLDSNEYYGGFWSSFNLESLGKYVEECRNGFENLQPTTEGVTTRDDLIALKRATRIENVSERWFDFEKHGDIDGWNKGSIMKEFRRFNIDLCPKLLYARGAMVELLISSNICRYAEFRAVDRVETVWNEKIMTVPCSRSDVFTSRDVNVVEKRLLMKFLQSCASYDGDGDEHNAQDIEGKTFREYLNNHKLTPNLIHYLLYTIAMGNDKTSCREGLEGVKKFLLSLGRYGNSPFLFPMYGCGEIPQCFCRLCAVFGGVYCLSKFIDGANLDQERTFRSLRCSKQTIEAKHLVVGQGYTSEDIINETLETKTDSNRNRCGKMARAVILTNIPLGGLSQNTGGGGVSFMKLPPAEGHEDGATVIQLAHFSGTCPKNIYLIHVTVKSISNDPKADLEPYIVQILNREVPKSTQAFTDVEPIGNKEESNVSTVLYELYFNIPSCVTCSHNASKDSLPKGIHLTCGPFYELDYDVSIARAKEIFKDIYPEEEFLPRAPDPEEIIIGDETDEGQEIIASAEEIGDQEKVESARECRESESSVGTVPSVTGISDAQEAKEEAIENAEECLERK